MILIACLFAPTVPSEPSPQILQAFISVTGVNLHPPHGRDVLVTSSLIPSVKRFFGWSCFRFSNTCRIMLGSVSLDPRPKRPPIIIGAAQPCCSNALQTSRNNGSPIDPGSFVRSNTATRFTVFGTFSIKCFTENGRYRCTLTKPVFSPFAFKKSIASSIVSFTDPMATIMFSASSAP